MANQLKHSSLWAESYQIEWDILLWFILYDERGQITLYPLFQRSFWETVSNEDLQSCVRKTGEMYTTKRHYIDMKESAPVRELMFLVCPTCARSNVWKSRTRPDIMMGPIRAFWGMRIIFICRFYLNYQTSGIRIPWLIILQIFYSRQ